jgi:ABC-2 type transport system permease protein
MRKFFQVVRYEYQRHVFRRGFLFALLSVPLMIGVMALVVILLLVRENRTSAVGYVDSAGIITQPYQAEAIRPFIKAVSIQPYVNESLARAGLDSGEIQAYYVFPVDYLQTGTVSAVYYEQPGDEAERIIRDYLRENLLAGQPEAVQYRLSEGIVLAVQSADGSREIHEGDWFSIFIPVLAGLAFVMAIFISSGYLMQAVVEEKENRTMEILVTSLPPGQLIMGKILGITGVGLTQLLVWALVAGLGINYGRSVLPWMEGIRFPASSILLLSAVFLPAYLMIASLMAAIGSTVTEAREGQQVTGLITLPVVIPYMLAGQIILNPNSPLALGLTFFPFTAPVALSMRLGFTQVPGWQLGVYGIVMTASALGALWLAGRAFRLGMLRYGQRLTVRELFQFSAPRRDRRKPAHE